jgi:hypothetical protein
MMEVEGNEESKNGVTAVQKVLKRYQDVRSIDSTGDRAASVDLFLHVIRTVHTPWCYRSVTGVL